MMFVLKLFTFICLYKLSESADVSQVNEELEIKYYDLNEGAKLFEEYMKTYNKEYRSTEEYNERFNKFMRTLRRINELNKGSKGEVYGITEFADLSLDEFVHEHTGFNTDVPLNNTKVAYRNGFRRLFKVNLPENWDWRSKGIVTPVRDQHRCQSCWAFSAVACVESQYAKKHGVLLALSEQQLVDCYKRDCRTGDFPHRAFNYVARNGGFMLNKDYPYTGVVGRCQFQASKAPVKVRGGNQYRIRNEEELKQLVYSYGPVSIGIHADYGFVSYRHGIATARKLGCTANKSINHAVVIVGYGTENGVPYWIIKNSASSRWGEQGYMRLVRGANACNILTYVAVAVVE